MSPPPSILSLYRRFLRELPVKTRTTRTAHQKLSSPSPLQKRIRAQLSQSTSPTDATASTTASTTSSATATSSATDTATAQAEQFIQYLQAQRMYATLIERYNPGMGMSEEERVRLSARRIGMNLPVEFGEGN